MSRKEYQIKFKGSLESEFLLSLGAQLLGSVVQEDIYLRNEYGSTPRIRKEKDHYLYTNKRDRQNDIAREREIDEMVISEKEANALIKENGVLVTCVKERNLYQLNDVSIVQDTVHHLGEFIEIRSSKGIIELITTANMIGLDISQKVNKSHLEMIMEVELPYYVQIAIAFHEKSEYIFGITSGILTALGLLIGVNSATSNELSVISAILTIAIADSSSDAYGMYSCKISERGTSHESALKYALGTFFGKFFLSLAFIIPVASLGLKYGVIIDILAGVSFLALMSAEQAVVSGKPILAYVLKRTSFSVAVLSICYLAGIVIKTIIPPL